MQIERELKFRLPARAAARVWQLLPPVAKRRRQIDSVYYDTPLMELRGMHAALRLRRDGRKWLQTLKLDAGPNPGLSARYEWEAPLRRAELDVAALPMREIEAAARGDLRPTLLRVRPVFSTRFERRSARFALPGGGRVEACVDRGWIIAGARRVRLLELEIELLEGEAAALLSFAEGLIAPLGLVLELQSKAERGYRLAAGEPAAPLKASRPAFDCRGPATDALAAASLAALAQIAANLEGVAASRDPEYLHQARVGMRRLRSSLRAWRHVAQGNPAKGLEKGLRGFSADFGPARDWDVFCELLEARLLPKGRSSALLRRAHALRRRARAEAARAAVSPQCQIFLLQAMRWVDEAPWRAAPGGSRALSAAGFAREQLARLEKRAARCGAELDWGDAPARHELRIRLKRLRYMAEFFARCFPARATERYIDRLKGLQDLLGELNDLAVADGLLARVGKGAAAAPARRVIAARERALVRGLRPAWKRFRKTRRFWPR